MQQLLEKLFNSVNLSQQESYQLFSLLIKGQLDPVVTSSLLTALKIKGESANENCWCSNRLA